MIAMLLFWSKWQDIETFRYCDTGYLLQGRYNKITNAKKFRVVPFKGIFPFYVNTPFIDKETLRKANLFKNNV